MRLAADGVEDDIHVVRIPFEAGRGVIDRLISPKLVKEILVAGGGRAIDKSPPRFGKLYCNVSDAAGSGVIPARQLEKCAARLQPG